MSIKTYSLSSELKYLQNRIKYNLVSYEKLCYQYRSKGYDVASMSATIGTEIYEKGRKLDKCVTEFLRVEKMLEMENNNEL